MEVISTHSTPVESIWVAFIIDTSERNIIDQKWIETTLFEEFKIKSMRVTFEDVHKYGQIDPTTNILTIKGKEIGFVYYRTGY